MYNLQIYIIYSMCYLNGRSIRSVKYYIHSNWDVINTSKYAVVWNNGDTFATTREKTMKVHCIPHVNWRVNIIHRCDWLPLIRLYINTAAAEAIMQQCVGKYCACELSLRTGWRNLHCLPGGKLQRFHNKIMPIRIECNYLVGIPQVSGGIW